MFEQHTLLAEREVHPANEVEALDGILQPLSVAPVAPANAGFQPGLADHALMLRHILLRDILGDGRQYGGALRDRDFRPVHGNIFRGRTPGCASSGA